MKKLIKKYKLLKKYKKGKKQWLDFMWLLHNFKHSREDEHYYRHDFMCELRCYNRLKNF